MQIKTAEVDLESDTLIDIIVDSNYSSVERAQASMDLYHRHSHWVIKRIGERIFNVEDVQDIAQNVWIMVLQPEKLSKQYTAKEGKFRAYLQAPIRWAILKHIDQLPFNRDEAGNKVAVQMVELNDDMLSTGLDQALLNDVIERVIKPKLRELDLRSRNVYMLNEHPVIFQSEPTLNEASSINAIGETKASALLDSAKQKVSDRCTDEELSIYIPVEYQSFVKPTLSASPSGDYLAGLIGISDGAFRKRLHTARQFLKEMVRENLPSLSGDFNHG